MPTDKSLVRAKNGNPAQTYHPSSKSYQESHGSNNTPHMKVTDTDGNPIDPREVDNSSVVSELQAMKQDIAETKQTQADILEKLNGTVDTQLIGSNVEQRGTSANKPDADSVEIGTTYWSVDTDPQGDDIEISDGTQWVVLQ